MTEKQNLREQIAYEAAVLLRNGEEPDVWSAKRRAARTLGIRAKRNDLPSNGEIREQIRRMQEIESSVDIHPSPREILLYALRLMRQLSSFHPRLRCLSDVAMQNTWDFTLRVYAENIAIFLGVVTKLQLPFTVLPSIGGQGTQEQPYECLEVRDDLVCRIEVGSAAQIGERWFDSNSNSEIESMTIRQLEDSLSAGSSLESLEREIEGINLSVDRFEYFLFLLDRLDGIEQDPRTHPEGDALFHSLQVYDLAVSERPYDEEFLTAALLHDVGKIAKTVNHMETTLGLLAGSITHRTAWLIASLPDAKAHRERTLDLENRARIELSEDFEDLQLLEQLNQKGRSTGVEVSTPLEAINYLKSLDFGDAWK